MKDHWPEYLAEFFGTALMMMIGVGAIVLMWSSTSVMPELIPSEALRRLITGTLFAGGATAVVLSPLGQRSGGHINPAVTFAFWWKDQVTTPDAICYVVAQVLGACLGVLVIALTCGEAAQSVQLGITLPGAGYTAGAAFVAEIIITFLLVFLILYCVNNSKLASRTPWLAGSLVAFLVLVEAPVSGTSLNPARSFAPALLTGNFEFNWIYWIAPMLGALAAVLVFAYLFESKRNSGCAKLYHTERYRCIFTQCVHTVIPAGTVLLREGDDADKAFVLERGALEVRKRDEAGVDHVLGTVGPGEWVGEMALLLSLPRSATVVATEDSQVRAVNADNFAHVIAEHPTETMRLLQQLSARLHEANSQLVV
jgi:aquaporin Z